MDKNTSDDATLGFTEFRLCRPGRGLTLDGSPTVLTLLFAGQMNLVAAEVLVLLDRELNELVQCGWAVDRESLRYSLTMPTNPEEFEL